MNDVSPLNAFIASADASRGRLQLARARALRHATALEQRGLLELAALQLAEHASREALAGAHRFAAEIAPRVEKLTQRNALPRLVTLFAQSLNPAAQKLFDDVPPEMPAVAPPAFNLGRAMTVAQLALHRGRAAEAVGHLAPFEDVMAIDGPGLRAMYVYANALLSAGNTEKAIAQCRRILDTVGLDPTHIVHVVARVQLARTLARAGKTEEARKAYEEFLAAWKDADPDVPILVAARREHAQLR